MTAAYVRMSVVKLYVQGRVKDLRVGRDAIDALDKKIETLIDEAIRHAHGDGRKTIKERDFA